MAAPAGVRGADFAAGGPRRIKLFASLAHFCRCRPSKFQDFFHDLDAGQAFALAKAQRVALAPIRSAVFGCIQPTTHKVLSSNPHRMLLCIATSRFRILSVSGAFFKIVVRK